MDLLVSYASEKLQLESATGHNKLKMKREKAVDFQNSKYFDKTSLFIKRYLNSFVWDGPTWLRIKKSDMWMVLKRLKRFRCIKCSTRISLPRLIQLDLISISTYGISYGLGNYQATKRGGERDGTARTVFRSPLGLTYPCNVLKWH